MIANGWEQKHGLRLLQRALSATQNGVMITDATEPDDPIVWVNAAFAKITGYTPEEVLGRNPRFLQAGDSDQPALDELRASRESNDDDVEWTGTLRNYKKDGTPFCNELVAAAVRDEGGRATHHIGVIADVTKREEAEEQLRFQARLLDAVGQAVVAVDLSGRITYWNRAAERLYGWPSGEAVGRPAEEVMVSEEQMERAGEIWGELVAGRSWSGEFVVRHRDGTAFPAAVTNTPVFDERGGLVGIIGVSEDVTERKEAEEERLRISREYEEMVRALPNVVFRCRRAPDGGTRLTYSEGALAREFGVDTARAAGRPFGELFPPEFLSTVVPAFERAFAGETVEFPSRIGDRSFANVAMPFRAASGARGRGRQGGQAPADEIVGYVTEVTERVRAEEALGEAEERYRTLVEQVPAVTYVQEVEHDRTAVFVSPQIERMTGYRPEDFYADPGLWHGMVHSGDRGRVEAEDERTDETGEPYSMEHRVVHREGRVSWVRDEAVLVEDEQGRPRYWHGVMFDLTARKEAEAALRESEERFRALVRNSSDIITVLATDGTVRYQSQALERLMGYRPEEMIGENVFGFVHPDDWQRTLEAFAESLRSPEAPVRAEFRFRRKDGSWRHLEATGSNLLSDPAVGGVVINTRDVTRRVEAEDALRKSNDLLRAVMEGTTDAVFVKDLEGRYLMINRAGAEDLGKTVEEVLGKTDAELFADGDGREVMESDREIMASGGVRTIEDTKTTEEGATRTFLATKGPYRDAEGDVVGLFGVSRDITERKEAEEALRESERRFRQLFENSADALFVIHPQTREVVDCNREACRSLGYPREELLGLRLGDFASEVLTEEEKGRRGGDTPWRRALAGEPGTIIGFHENEHRRKDGTTFPVEVGVGSIDYAGRRMILASARDATERKRAEEALRLRDRAIAESKDGVVITGPNEQDQPMVYVNRGFERMTGYAAEELLGRNCRMLQGPDTDQPALGGLRAALGEGREWSGILRNYRKDGTPFWNELSVSPVRDEGGSVTHFVGVMNDVTGRKELEERLEHQAFHDPLTGLPNRALFADRLAHALARTQRSGRSVAVLFLDLDNFKYVNDSLGHEKGDDLLAAAARRLEGCVRPGDTVARFGGDEFALLLEGARDAVEARRVAERAVEALGEPFDLGEAGREVFSGASVGVASGEAGRDRSEDLLRKADLALYEAKREGKARHAVFDPETERRSVRRLELENGLRRAVERDQIVVLYQPVVSLKTGRMAGFEALARWQHPERGLLAPDEFVPLAEENGLIVPIGERVLREACRQAEAWQERHPSGPPLVVGVNLSARQLSYPDLVTDVEAILEETGLDPGRLTLEVTESALVEDAERHAGALRGLRDLGVRFAIDDFGTGYSSLSYLRRLPAGLLKLDGSFVGGIGGGAEEDEVLLQGVIGIAHGLGLRVVAEAVETAEQASRLRELGCDLAQGNHFSAPLSGEEASRFLASSARG